VSSDALILLSCIKDLGGIFGLNLPIDVLRGSNVCVLSIFDITFDISYLIFICLYVRI
jgi:hypothetical protein